MRSLTSGPLRHRVQLSAVAFCLVVLSTPGSAVSYKSSHQPTLRATGDSEPGTPETNSEGATPSGVTPVVTLTALALNATTVTGGAASQGTVTLSAASPATGTLVSLASSNTSVAAVPAGVTVPAGSASAIFTVSTSQASTSTSVTITASLGGSTRTATLTVNATPPPAPVTLTVLVHGVDGGMIPGAAICLAPAGGGSPSAFTDAAGRAVFNNIAQGQITIAVSSSGFIGHSITSTLGAGGGTANFLLSQGSGGPVCVPTTPPPSPIKPPGGVPRIPPGLQITSFDPHTGVRKTPLFFEGTFAINVVQTPSGAPVVPAEFRISEFTDFHDTAWQPYSSGATFQLHGRNSTLTAYGARTLNIQVRTGDLQSAIVSKTIDIEPLQLVEFHFQSDDLRQMLTFAQAAGFPLQFKLVSATSGLCADGGLVNDLDVSISGLLPKTHQWTKVIDVSLANASGRALTPVWRVKTIDIGSTSQFPPSVTQRFDLIPDGNNFNLRITLTAPPSSSGNDSLCFLSSFPLASIVLEGPPDDIAIDQTKRWKNAFPPH